jgi:GNAT superfamily N-acetyltransferase
MPIHQSSIVVRTATEGDVEAVAAVWADGWGDGHAGHVPAALHAHRRRADFRRLVPGRLAGTAVAVLDGRVAGFVTVHGDELEQLYVTAGARGTGVAAALLAHGERTIAAGGFARAWLAVVAGNTRARRFYERCGWHDGGPFAYAAEVDGGTFAVPARRYEKRVLKIECRHPLPKGLATLRSPARPGPTREGPVAPPATPP